MSFYCTAGEPYTMEDLETDLDWFDGLGVDNSEAKKYNRIFA